jgi:hypothetical protein
MCLDGRVTRRDAGCRTDQIRYSINEFHPVFVLSVYLFFSRHKSTPSGLIWSCTSAAMIWVTGALPLVLAAQTVLAASKSSQQSIPGSVSQYVVPTAFPTSGYSSYYGT